MSQEGEKIVERDRPWIFRTYAGHSTAAQSNKLYRGNLAKGQTGLSVAFDLPTQTGYDPDDLLAQGEVGKVGVPVAHLGDMRALFHEIPLERMNTSMTINATAPWLLSLYIAAADEQGADRKLLSGTTQNDIIKEYLSRGTYVFPPAPSLKLTTDVIAWTYSNMPKWNPMNVCSYHLQEAGATPGPGTILCPRDRNCHSGLDESQQGNSGRGFSKGSRTDFVFRQRRHAVHNRNLQDACLHGALGRNLPGSVMVWRMSATDGSVMGSRSIPSG